MNTPIPPYMGCYSIFKLTTQRHVITGIPATVAIRFQIFKGEVHPVSSHTENEGLRTMNTKARKRIFKKCHIQQKQLCICLVFGGYFPSPSLCEEFSDLTNPTSNQYF